MNDTKNTVSTLLILGGTSDLASRLLLPGLGRLLTEQPDRRIRLIGSGRQDWDDEQWTDTVLSLIHISEPTRRYAISYAVFC